jgi:hypothetical protein
LGVDLVIFMSARREERWRWTCIGLVEGVGKEDLVALGGRLS